MLEAIRGYAGLEKTPLESHEARMSPARSIPRQHSAKRERSGQAREAESAAGLQLHLL